MLPVALNYLNELPLNLNCIINKLFSNGLKPKVTRCFLCP